MACLQKMQSFAVVFPLLEGGARPRSDFPIRFFVVGSQPAMEGKRELHLGGNAFQNPEVFGRVRVAVPQ
jgi:hypothetical protein